jgi:hypothetical protein
MAHSNLGCGLLKNKHSDDVYGFTCFHVCCAGSKGIIMGKQLFQPHPNDLDYDKRLLQEQLTIWDAYQQLHLNLKKKKDLYQKLVSEIEVQQTNQLCGYCYIGTMGIVKMPDGSLRNKDWAPIKLHGLKAENVVPGVMNGLLHSEMVIQWFNGSIGLYCPVSLRSGSVVVLWFAPRCCTVSVILI